jgi:GT2 family glycosyltransferase
LLSALARQTFPLVDFEVLVVNNGSSDETAEVANDFARKEELKVRLAFEPRRGVNHARNRAVVETRTEFIAFIDDDEIPGAEWLTSLVGGMRRFPDAGCVGGPVSATYAYCGLPRTCERCDLTEGSFHLDADGGIVEVVGGGNAIFRRSAFRSVGMFNPALSGHGDDFEWMLRSAAAGFPIYYVASADVEHVRDRVTVRAAVMKSFLRARSAAQFERASGRTHPRPATLVSRIPRYLAHAARYRCWGGVTQASSAAGRAVGVVQTRARGSHKVTSRS